MSTSQQCTDFTSMNPRLKKETLGITDSITKESTPQVCARWSDYRYSDQLLGYIFRAHSDSFVLSRYFHPKLNFQKARQTVSFISTFRQILDRKVADKWTKRKNNIVRKIHGIKEDFLFNSVIRTSFESFLDIGFASAYNTYNIRWENEIDVYSNIVAFVWIALFAFELCSILIIYFNFDKHYSEETIKTSRIKVLLESFKNDRKICILDHFIFLVRRILLILILIFWWNHGFYQAWLFLLVWVLVLASKLILRPYNAPILNVQDILFEAILWTVLVLFITFSTQASELANSGKFLILGIMCFAQIIFLILINYTILAIWTIREIRRKKKAKKMGRYVYTTKKPIPDPKNIVVDFADQSQLSDISGVRSFNWEVAGI